MKRILIMAGGTGGHVFPALAVAEYLRKQEIDIHWLGTPRGLENEIVTQAGIPLHHIQASGWRRNGIKKWLFAPFSLVKGISQACRLIKKINPDVILGMGGFASGPGGLAAWLLRKPLIIHEQNAVAGLTNRILALFATRVLCGFPNAFPKFVHAEVTGNPIRAAISELAAPSERFGERVPELRLLILGGSQGAQKLNQVVPVALAELDKSERPTIWHQTGRTDYDETKQRYALLGLTANIHPFIEDMANAYAWADVVICRAGALTVSELAAAGVGSILIPFPYAVDNHQFYNARYLEQGKAAVIIEQKNMTPVRLAELLHTLLNRKQLLTMAERAKQLATPDATKQVAEWCLQSSKINLKKIKSVDGPKDGKGVVKQ